MAFTQEQRDEIMRLLQERGANNPCEVCGRNEFVIHDTAVQLTLRDVRGAMLIPSPSIPAVPIICRNCGNTRLHALGALGMLPREKQQ